MRIDSASINFAAQFSRQETTQQNASLSFSLSQPTPLNSRAAVVISDAGQAAAEHAKAIENATQEVDNDPRLILLRSLIERLTGQKLDRLTLKDFVQTAPPINLSNVGDAKTPAAPSAGYSLAYDYHSSTTIEQQVSFNAEGVIRTQDGQEIGFKLTFDLATSHTEQVDVNIRAGDAARVKDPLVLNFNGNAAALSDLKFAFDLNADGKTEQISLLQPGSGFLALDKNGDHKINNGNELFGPNSGNGFADLAAYDSDHNQFIDEADAVYQQLQIFTPDATGNGSLVSLKDVGVGAIYLGNTATPFDLNGGVLRSSGIFLNENGSAGTVQQIDLKV